MNVPRRDKCAAARAARTQNADEHAARLAVVIEEARGLGVTACANIAHLANADGLRAPRGGLWTGRQVAAAMARLPGGRKRLTVEERHAAMLEGRRAEALMAGMDTAVGLVQAARRVRRAGRELTVANVAREAGRSEGTARRYWGMVCRNVQPFPEPVQRAGDDAGPPVPGVQ